MTAESVLSLQRMIGNRATGRFIAQREQRAVAQGSSPQIQRRIEWLDGARTKNVNLVTTLTAGRDFGTTPAIVNGQEFPGGNPAQAIFPPELAFAQTPDGQTKVTVQSDPINIVGYRMDLPAPAPWQLSLGTDHAVSAVEMQAPVKLDQYKERAADQTLLTLTGQPTDDKFAKMVEVHENHHVGEIETGVAKILKPWDKGLSQFRTTQAPITASDRATAEEALYSAVGGTPADVGKALVDDFRDSGLGFHKTHAGGPPKITQVTTNAKRSELTVYEKHPLD